MLCPFITGVVFSLFTCRWLYPTIGMEYYSFKRRAYGEARCYDKRVWWRKKASLCVHSLKITKLSKWFFCANVVVYECYTRTIYCRPFTTPQKNIVFSFCAYWSQLWCTLYMYQCTRIRLDESLRGFCNFNKLLLVILYTTLVFSLKFFFF